MQTQYRLSWHVFFQGETNFFCIWNIACVPKVQISNDDVDQYIEWEGDRIAGGISSFRTTWPISTASNSPMLKKGKLHWHAGGLPFITIIVTPPHCGGLIPCDGHALHPARGAAYPAVVSDSRPNSVLVCIEGLAYQTSCTIGKILATQLNETCLPAVTHDGIETTCEPTIFGPGAVSTSSLA